MFESSTSPENQKGNEDMGPFVCWLEVVMLRKDRFEERDPFTSFHILFDPYHTDQPGINYYSQYLMFGGI